MQTPPMNNTSKPMSAEEHGSSDTSSVLQLDPWDIAHLLICKRDEQPICIEDATDDEFDAWVQSQAIAVKENGIPDGHSTIGAGSSIMRLRMAMHWHS